MTIQICESFHFTAFSSNVNLRGSFNFLGMDLGEGCWGCAPPSYDDLWVSKIISILQKKKNQKHETWLKSFLSGAPLLSKILDLPIL